MIRHVTLPAFDARDPLLRLELPLPPGRARLPWHPAAGRSISCVRLDAPGCDGYPGSRMPSAHAKRSETEAMIHDQERVDALRAAAKVGIDALNALQAKTTDSGFHELLVLPRNQFSDIESDFLSQSQLENQDRPPVAEASWLDDAERFLDTPRGELRRLQELFNTHGPGIKVMIV